MNNFENIKIDPENLQKNGAVERVKGLSTPEDFLIGVESLEKWGQEKAFQFKLETQNELMKIEGKSKLSKEEIMQIANSMNIFSEINNLNNQANTIINPNKLKSKLDKFFEITANN